MSLAAPGSLVMTMTMLLIPPALPSDAVTSERAGAGRTIIASRCKQRPDRADRADREPHPRYPMLCSANAAPCGSRHVAIRAFPGIGFGPLTTLPPWARTAPNAASRCGTLM